MYVLQRQGTVKHKVNARMLSDSFSCISNSCHASRAGPVSATASPPAIILISLSSSIDRQLKSSPSLPLVQCYSRYITMASSQRRSKKRPFGFQILFKFIFPLALLSNPGYAHEPIYYDSQDRGSPVIPPQIPLYELPSFTETHEFVSLPRVIFIFCIY